MTGQQREGGAPDVKATSDAPVVVVPPVEIDMGTATPFANELADAIATGAARVEVDFSAVTFCDSTGLRVLVAAVKLARAAGCALVIEQPTERLLRLADLLGASDVLGLPPPRPRR